MPALHHPDDQTGLSLDELEIELDRIEAKRQEIDRLYLEESAADYQRHLSRVYGISIEAWDTPTIERTTPDSPEINCPACGDTGEIEDEEGFFTDCKVCQPENPEPWIIPASSKGA